MRENESISKKASRLAGTFKNLSARLKEAIKEDVSVPDDLKCIHKGTLDFDRVEADILGIHKNSIARGEIVIRSDLYLDRNEDLMEIRTYVERDSKTFLQTISASVMRVENLPTEASEELKKHGTVEMQLKV